MRNKVFVKILFYFLLLTITPVNWIECSLWRNRCHVSLQHEGRILRSGEVIMPGGPLPTAQRLMLGGCIYVIRRRTSIARFSIGSFLILNIALLRYLVSLVDRVITCFCCRCMLKSPQLHDYRLQQFVLRLGQLNVNITFIPSVI